MSVRPKPHREGKAPVARDRDSNGLPKGWAATELREIAMMRLGKMLDAGKQAGEPLPYLRNINVRWGEIDTGDLLTMRFKEREAKEFAIRDGDVLVCEGGEPGRAAVWNQGPTNIKFQKAIHRIRVSDAIEPRLLMYHLRNDAINGALAEYFTGSTIKHLTGLVLQRYAIRLPPLAEQRRIVAKLEELLGRVSRAKARLDRVPALLKRFRQSVLAAACSGKLTADWRERNCIADVDWSESRAEDLCEAVQSGSTPNADLFLTEKGVPFLKVYNIVNQAVSFEYRPQFVSEQTHRTILRRACALPGDVLMNIVGPPLGKVAIVPEDHPRWSINQAIVLFRPRPHLDRRFLYLVLCSGIPYADILSETRGSAGQSNISLSQCRHMQLPVPPLPEQHEIVQRVEKLFAFADQIEARLSKAKAQVDRLTQSILAKAFRGELVPTEAELARLEGRDYEPASKLLQRIRSERELATPASPKPAKRKTAQR
jgi:type I restriction enzyme, S subunit